MPDNDALNAVMPVIDELDRLGVPYYIGGSLASSPLMAWCATVDADLVADLKPAHVNGLVAALKADYYIDAGMIRSAITARSCCNLIHLATSFKVDIFVVKGRPYDLAAMAHERKGDPSTLPRRKQKHFSPRPRTRYSPSSNGIVSVTKSPIVNGATSSASSSCKLADWISATWRNGPLN